MEAIVKFFQGIADAVTSLIDFLVGFVEDIVYIVKLTGQFVAEIPNYFSWLPAEVLATLITIFAVVVIYKVTGREG